MDFYMNISGGRSLRGSQMSEENTHSSKSTIQSKAELAKLFDHTMLKANASQADIEKLCEEARTHSFATVCVNPHWIPLCKKLLDGSSVLPITVVGFPLGAMRTEAKSFETSLAVQEGAKEIDMVINVGALKSGNWEIVASDIKGVLSACKGTPLKVILETSLLSSDEISKVSEIVSDAGAAFVKTSTGFGSRGASVEDIQLMKAAISPATQIKASGGIRTLADAESMVAAGAHRLGASASVSIIKEWEEKNG